MISQVNCPFWYFDDLSECGRTLYIDYYVPLIVLVAYLSFISYKIITHWYRRNYLRLEKTDFISELLFDGEDKPLLSDYSGVVYTNPDFVNDEINLKEEHFSIEKLKLMDINGNPHGTIEIIRRDFMEKIRVLLECLICIFQFSLHYMILINYENYKKDIKFNSPLVGLLLWMLLTITVVLRVFNLNQSIQWINKYPGNLWGLSFTSYVILFASKILPFRSIYIGHISNLIAKRYYLLQFYLNLILVLLLFTAKIGNQHCILYRTDPSVIPSPEPVSSIASFISWSWLNRFVWNSYLRPVQMRDIWGLMLEDYSIFVMKKFRQFVNSYGVNHNFSFNLIWFFSRYICLQAFWAFIESLVNFIPTILLKRVLEYVEDQNSTPANLAWFYIFGMFLCRIVSSLCQAQALFFGRRVCIRMKAIIISEIYTKALRRKITSNSSKQPIDDTNQSKFLDKDKRNGDEESTPANLGAIINLMAVDAFKVSEICAYLHAFIEATTMTIVALVLLYRLLGWSALVGAGLIICMLPLNFKLASLIGKLQKDTLAVTDRRIQKLNETFQAIRIIKFFSWEENFENNLLKIREEELRILLQRSVIWALTSFVWFIIPSIVTSISFAVYIYVQGSVLTTPVAFTASSLFILLRNPLDQLSDMLSFVVQSKVSLERIQEFLDEEETKKYEQLTVNHSRIGFENATICWDKINGDFKLKNLNIDFKLGKLNVIIGPTGSGKTSLLMGLLGEMELSTGKIYVPCLSPKEDLVIESDGMTNSIAYCSQASWLLNDTIKNNILFNAPFNEIRYSAVVSACGLKRDFQILKAGDQTEIGEKGITLSGGQKQRVSLARALYSSSRHLLLDDCLSAVDSHTALWIYENCITGPLMEGRTCILVSHNVAMTLKNAELVIILENGKVKDQGEPLELLNKGLLGKDELVKSSIMSRTNSSINIASKNNSKSGINLSEMHNDIYTEIENSNSQMLDEAKIKAGKLIMEEGKSDGVVSIDVYNWYGKLFGGWKTILFLSFILILAQVIYIGQSWWIRNWASHNILSKLVTVLNNNLYDYTTEYFMSKFRMSSSSKIIRNPSDIQSIQNTPTGPNSTLYYLSIYFLIGMVHGVVASSKTIINFMAGLNASRKIFNLVLKKVLYSKLRFFDSTPIGRIMNRFSKDIEAVDQELTPYLEGSIVSLIQCISTILLIAYITPGFLVVSLVIGAGYYLVAYFYLAGSRELKRFDSVTKSPIHQHFSETLVGITTIRAFGDERRFMLENLEKIDNNNKPFFYLWVANRWLAFRIDMIGSLVIFISGIFILLNVDTLDSGLAGISLTYAISFTEGALWLVRLYSNVEMNMNSVERLKEYMMIEQEPFNTFTNDPSPTWPEHGTIEINDLSLRYAPNLPKVIKNVSFNVDSKSKIGIVGRTGAGKSTIITALFRFLDPETGYIKIDNVDITTISLKRLRQSIIIIPQDPMLFAGTIKTNLDPYDEFTDEQIFQTLKRVNLITREELDSQPVIDNSSIISENVNRFVNLNSEILEGGSNLSQGQRQLICLARSLLRSPKVILLDEATASIDYLSDAKIQQTIREEFQDSTILTIAHRLRSIIDYDKILVMDAGEVKEYEHPYSLLLNKDSIFYSMCEDSGELDILIQLAKESFVKKLNSK